MSGREMWLEARKTGLGGSEMAAVIGDHPWCSPYTLYSRKLEIIPDLVDSKRMEWGKRHEETVAKWYEVETGRRVLSGDDLRVVLEAAATDDIADLIRRCAPGWTSPFDLKILELVRSIERTCIIEMYGDHYLLRHRDFHWMIGTPDAFIYDLGRESWGILELKCSDPRMKPDWADGPPGYNAAQIQSYMHLCGLWWGAFGVLFGFWDSGHLDVQRDPDLINRMLTTGGEMWRRMQEADPPPLDESASTNATVNLINAEGDPELPVFAFPDEAEDWDRKWVEHKAEAKRHAEKSKAMETLLRAEMGAHTEASLPSGVRWVSTQVEPKGKRAYRKYTRKAAR